MDHPLQPQFERQKQTLCRLVLTALLLLLTPAFAHAAAEEILSPGGLRVWLVEDHQAPVFTLGFRFAGGSAEDPEGKEGLAHLAAEMFYQGAGRFSADDYLQQWGQLGAEINIEARVESVRGTIRVLTPDRDKAADLLALALTAPRYDRKSLDQVRDQITAEIDRNASDPEASAYLAYDQLAFGRHPRARPLAGTRASVAALSGADVAKYRQHVLTRAGLSLSAVGDITPAELGPLVDRIFAALPAHGETARIDPPSSTVAQRRDLALPTGQAEVVFGVGLPGLSERESRAAELVNYSFGGSAFTSRLFHEVREKRGLAYAIGSSLDRYSFMSELSGSFGSAPATVEEAVGLVQQQFKNLAQNPPTDAEIAEAKVALAGQYLRGLIRHADMANELTLRQSQGQRPDYIDTYASKLAEISPDEVRALARRTPWLDRLVVVTVGAPAQAGRQAIDRSRLHLPQAQEP